MNCSRGRTSAIIFLTSSSQGQYCQEGSAVAKICAAQNYCPDPSTQLACPTGFSCPENSRYAIPCPPGNLCPANSEYPLPCPEQMYCPTADANISCEPMDYCPENSTAPQKFPSGVFRNGSVFIQCPIGYFCKVNATVPEPCPFPATTMALGASSFLNCACPKGTYGRVSSATIAECTVCPIGQFCRAVSVACTC